MVGIPGCLLAHFDMPVMLVDNAALATRVPTAAASGILASRTAASEFAASFWTRLVGTGFAPDQSLDASSLDADDATSIKSSKSGVNAHFHQRLDLTHGKSPRSLRVRSGRFSELLRGL
ncbi:hypothetical protein G6O67_006819 [Ophiocordyceps sinensis]|uniref:Uncharacterized protein n=1 Tax=Ophiocordyceps sinensis TaxID=72228 RepID=A0A8H4PP88_9HYPO|nr:hypothetical protein G6O67_006819 [Ophiocordyceps sinensis]